MLEVKLTRAGRESNWYQNNGGRWYWSQITSGTNGSIYLTESELERVISRCCAAEGFKVEYISVYSC